MLYQGTLSAGRLDIDLCVALARSLSGQATLVFVGPSSLPGDVGQALVDAGAVILGRRPYTEMAAYLQHADVQAVPHQTTPFIESLDPLKAREFLAVGRPAVATPVAGFRDLDPPITVADRHSFVEAVLGVLARPPHATGPRTGRQGAGDLGGAGGQVPGRPRRRGRPPLGVVRDAGGGRRGYWVRSLPTRRSGVCAGPFPTVP